MGEPLVAVRDLSVAFFGESGPIRAVDRVSFDIAPGEALGLAGESGSGKSTIAQALLRLLAPPAVIVGGEVRYRGVDVLRMGEAELASLRWRRVAIVPQSSLDALNPVLSIGDHFRDTFLAAGVTSRSEIRDRSAALLGSVGIAPERLRAYPHELSGGMRQRVSIALALALDPELLILDEPTTALDVIVERDILALLADLKRRRSFAMLFVTHDLHRMAQICDRIAVVYGGRVAEVGPAATMMTQARHPYANALVRAVPRVSGGPRKLEVIGGAPPSLANPPSGCRFHPRCARAATPCADVAPDLAAHGAHHVACHHPLPPDRDVDG